MSAQGENVPIVFRGRSIRSDENGLICLDDIWGAAGYRKNKRPANWRRIPTTNPRIEKVLALVTGNSRNITVEDMRRVYRTRRHQDGGGTYADPRLALDYAEYLSPALAIEVKEIFLRYKAADPTLADDIMARADAAAERMAKRTLGRAARQSYTLTLKQHGLTDRIHYAECTNATYVGLWDKTAAQLKRDKGNPANLRDTMDTKELVSVAFAEVMSSDRIEDEDCRGFVECRNATSKVARAVRGMIDCDRKDRQQRLLP